MTEQQYCYILTACEWWISKQDIHQCKQGDNENKSHELRTRWKKHECKQILHYFYEVTN